MNARLAIVIAVMGMSEVARSQVPVPPPIPRTTADTASQRVISAVLDSLERKASGLQQQVAKLRDTSATGSGGPATDNAERVAAVADSLEKEHKQTEEQAKYWKMAWETAKRMGVGSGERGLFPVLSESDAEKFWQQSRVTTLTSASVVGERDFLGASVELMSGILGPVRLGAGTVIIAASSDTEGESAADSVNRESESLNRLLQNGGAFHLTASWPAVMMMREDGRLGWVGMVRGAAGWDTPAINQFADSGAAVGMLSAETGVHGITTNGAIGLETGLLWQRYWVNGDFAARVNTSERGAGYVGWRLGAILFRKTRVGAMITIDDSGLLRDKVNVRYYIQQIDLP